MRPVSSHFLNLSIVEPQEFNVEQAQAEQEQAEQIQAEQIQAEQEQAEQAQADQERKSLFKHLKPVKTSYQPNLCCIDSTHQSLLNQIINWAANKPGQENVLQSKTYWCYSSPGIRKTSLAHSICK